MQVRSPIARVLSWTFCAALVVPVVACKPRKDESAVKSDEGGGGGGGGVPIDRFVIGRFLEEGKKQDGNFGAILKMCSGGWGSDDVQRIKFMDDTIQRETRFTGQLLWLLQKYEKGEGEINPAGLGSADKGSVTRVKSKLGAIYDALKPTFNMSLCSDRYKEALDKARSHHGEVLKDLAVWVGSGNQDPFAEGVAGGGGGQNPQAANGNGGNGGGGFDQPQPDQPKPHNPKPKPAQPNQPDGDQWNQGGGGGQWNGGGQPVADDGPCPGVHTQDELRNNPQLRTMYYKKMIALRDALAQPSTIKNSSINGKSVRDVVASAAAKQIARVEVGECGPNYQRMNDCVGGPLIAHLKKVTELKCLFDSDSGVSENFTLEEHTRMVEQVYAAQKKFYDVDGTKVGSVSAASLFPLVLALHDIGKPVAVAAGDKDRQHEFTSPIVRGVMDGLGYSDLEIRFALSLIDQDIIGTMSKAIDYYHKDLDSATQVGRSNLGKFADALHMGTLDFSKMQVLYFVSDAASYPGLQQNIFHRGCGAQERMCLNNGSLERLMVDHPAPAAAPTPPPSHEMAPPPPPDAPAKAVDNNAGKAHFWNMFGGGGGNGHGGNGFLLEDAEASTAETAVNDGSGSPEPTVDRGGLTPEFGDSDSFATGPYIYDLSLSGG